MECMYGLLYDIVVRRNGNNIQWDMYWGIQQQTIKLKLLISTKDTNVENCVWKLENIFISSNNMFSFTSR